MIAQNNIFNIRFNPKNHWLGQIGSNKGFCEFSTQGMAVRAAARLIFSTYKKRGWVTPEQIIGHFAPPSENNTEYYINFVCRMSGIRRYLPIPAGDCRGKFLYAMAIMESGNNVDITEDQIISILKREGLW